MGFKIKNSKVLNLPVIAIFLYICSINIALASPSKNEAIIKAPTKQDIIVPQEKPIKHILYIAIDGIDNKTFNNINLPNLKGIWTSGIKTNQGISVFPPNIKSITENILTGIDNPDISKIKSQKFSNLINIIKSYDRKTAFIEGANDKLMDLTKSADIIVSMPNASSKEVIDRAIEIINDKKPYFLGLTLNNGELNQKNVQNNNNYITNIDNQIGRLVYKLTEMGIYDNTLTVIVGVNNLRTNNKTNNILNEDSFLNLLVMRGPGIKVMNNNLTIKLRDIMPTIDFLSSGKYNEEIEGKVLWDIIQKQDLTNEFLLGKRINDLNQEQLEDYYYLLQMKENENQLLIKQRKVKSEKDLIQNIINNKDREISKLKIKFNLLKFTSILLIGIFFIGYIIEYLVLKKKFLLF